MKPIPKVIGGAEVIAFTAIDGRHRPTGNTSHLVGGTPFGPACGLAICRYSGEEGYYLFYCDEEWVEVTDTWHEPLEDAEDQAEFEYEGTRNTWQSPA